MTNTPKISRLMISAVRAAAPVAVALIMISSATANARAAVLAHPATQQCLDANIHQGPFLNTCNGGSYQDWTARLVSGTTVTLVNAATQQCLDANIHQGPFLNTCNGGTYQQWDAHAVSGTTVSLVNVATQRCLDGNIHQGLFLNTCNAGSYQDWQVNGSWAYCLVNCSPPAPAPKPPTSKPPTASNPSPSPPSSSPPPPTAVPPAAPSPPVRRASPLPRRRRAHVSLGGTPRSLRNGQAIRLRGWVTRARVPGGAVVLLQAQVSPHHWITFGWARTSGNGSFSLRYQFTRTTGRQTYLMRAVLPTQFGYRARTSHSNVFRVRVAAGPA
jgi:hypothetical protein